MTSFNPIYQRYRLIALAVFLAVLVAGIVDWLYGGIGPSALLRLPEAPRFYSFIIAKYYDRNSLN